MHTVVLGQMEMLALAVVVLFAGAALNGRVRFFADNFIPSAVTGGLLFALLIWIVRVSLNVSFDYDMELRNFLLLVFFSTVGLSVKVETLLTGGKTLPLLVAAAAVFLLAQNMVGIGIASLFGADPVYGLVAGSISFAGGHGTAIAWGSELEASGLEGASTLGLAFATFGLVAGGLIGGPIARQLIKHFGVSTSTTVQRPRSIIEPDPDEPTEVQDDDDWLYIVLRTLLLLALCVSLGEVVNEFISDQGLRLPGFLTSMFVGILLANFTSMLDLPTARDTMDRFGTVSLQIFLAISMMTIELWTLGGVLDVMFLVLVAQILLMTAFAMLAVFFLAGRDYDAVVIAAGFSGLGLGATPVAIANINAVTSTYGRSPKAMLLIPLIGAFFIDLLNAGVIQFSLELLQR